jgi:hypothetical protein
VPLPAPDRSDFAPSFEKTEENGWSVDVGWAEGAMRDGRPFRAECWAQDQATYLTFFFSVVGLEECDELAVSELLAAEGLVRFASDKRPMTLKPFRDASGNDLWSVTFLVGDEGELFVAGGVPLRGYRGAPS